MLSEVIEKLSCNDQPIIKTIYDYNQTKIVAIGLRRGVQLTEHVAPCKATLLVIKGEVDFNTEKESRRYACFESYDIPLNLKHSVMAWDDAIILLFLSQELS